MKKIVIGIISLLTMQTEIINGAENLDNRAVSEKSTVVVNNQNSPPFRKENPLKDFSGFTVNVLLSSVSKSDFDKVMKIFKTQFEKAGKVVVLETEKGVDFTGYQGGAFLNYEINNIKTLNGKKTSINRASLSLETTVGIQKTQQSLPCYIWGVSCFLDDNLEKKLEENISKSLEQLLGQFVRDFSAANPNQKITFFFFSL